MEHYTIKINDFWNNLLLNTAALKKIMFIHLMSRVFAKGSIPGQVIPKTQKMVLDATLLNTQHFKVSIKHKVDKSGNGVVSFPTPQCCSY